MFQQIGCSTGCRQRSVLIGDSARLSMERHLAMENRREMREHAIDHHTGAKPGLLVIRDTGDPARGRGVFADMLIGEGSTVCQYKGVLMEFDPHVLPRSNYYFDFTIRNEYDVQSRIIIDATDEDGTFGRMINHGKTSANLKSVKDVDTHGNRIILFKATRDIGIGEELLYDYNDTSPRAVSAFPWLAC
jgi:hypothetical protein